MREAVRRRDDENNEEEEEEAEETAEFVTLRVKKDDEKERIGFFLCFFLNFLLFFAKRKH